MLMLIGKGGEGKSRIGLVMRSLLGDSMNTTSIQKVESNRFSRADLENKLLMVDDDMDMSALPKTNYIKSIVTSECKMDMERKGVQSYQSQLYVRFLCFGKSPDGAVRSACGENLHGFHKDCFLDCKIEPPVYGLVRQARLLYASVRFCTPVLCTNRRFSGRFYTLP